MENIETIIKPELKKISKMINNRIQKTGRKAFIPECILPIMKPYLTPTAMDRLIQELPPRSSTCGIFIVNENLKTEEEYTISCLCGSYIRNHEHTPEGLSFIKYLKDDLRNTIKREIAHRFYDSNVTDVFTKDNEDEYFDEIIKSYNNDMALACIYLSYLIECMIDEKELINIYKSSRSIWSNLYISDIKGYFKNKHKDQHYQLNAIHKVRVVRDNGKYLSTKYDVIFKSNPNTYIITVKEGHGQNYPFSEGSDLDEVITIKVYSNTQPPKYSGIELTEEGLTLFEMINYDSSNYMEIRNPYC
ncbi:hypothetical protein SOX05_08660 [Pseudomonas putida]|nr:hypothetical protein [Pseudomonas putida]MDY4319332.1 hypothetical protein [Pseudomonas putida]MDY4352717.1 hypothetical protein [Pseudomonas putida]